MRLFAVVVVALGSAASQAEASGGAATAKDAPLRPNIIFNLVDDLGWNDVSWHREGGNIVKTPYLESLANSGTKLQNYCERSRRPVPAPALPACSVLTGALRRHLPLLLAEPLDVHDGAPPLAHRAADPDEPQPVSDALASRRRLHSALSDCGGVFAGRRAWRAGSTSSTTSSRRSSTARATRPPPSARCARPPACTALLPASPPLTASAWRTRAT